MEVKLFPQVMSMLELDGYGWQQKIPFSLALSELVLDDMRKSRFS